MTTLQDFDPLIGLTLEINEKQPSSSKLHNHSGSWDSTEIRILLLEAYGRFRSDTPCSQNSHQSYQVDSNKLKRFEQHKLLKKGYKFNLHGALKP